MSGSFDVHIGESLNKKCCKSKILQHFFIKQKWNISEDAQSKLRESGTFRTGTKRFKDMITRREDQIEMDLSQIHLVESIGL